MTLIPNLRSENRDNLLILDAAAANASLLLSYHGPVVAEFLIRIVIAVLGYHLVNIGINAALMGEYDGQYFAR